MLTTLLLGASIGFSANQVMSQNEACQFSLDNDLYVSATHATLRKDDTELWRIDSDGSLTLNGESITTDRYSTELLQQYHQGVYSQTQNIATVVAEAIDIANFAVGSVLGELAGGKAQQKINNLQASISHELNQVISQDQETIIVRGSRLEVLGDNLDTAIESEMEEIIADSMGSILIQVGKSLLTGSGSFDDRIAGFEQRMEAMAAEVEVEVEQRAEALEARSEGMCEEVQRLAGIEQELMQRIPEFTEYRLFDLHSADQQTATTHP